MHARFLVVLILALPLLSNLAAAHLQSPIPFTLTLQKNMSLQWLPVSDKFDPPLSFGYLKGEGFCKTNAVGLAGYALEFYNESDQLIKTEYGLGSRTFHPHEPINFVFNGILARQVKYRIACRQAGDPLDTGYCDCIGIGFNVINHPQDFYMSGQFGVTRFIDKKDLTAKYSPESVGTTTSTIQGIFHAITPETSSQIINEQLQVTSSTPDVLVWLGDATGSKKPTATDFLIKDGQIDRGATKTANEEQIFACVDLDHNGDCDGEQAQTSCLPGDWYNGVCCKTEKIATEGCRTYAENNAYCGQTSDGKAQFATPLEIGQIHDFTACTTPAQAVVTDAQGTTKFCKADSQPEFFTIKNHQYYCDPTIPKITECGGDNKYSITNGLKTGQSTTIQGKTQYCLENAIFSTNLDYTTKKACEQAGQNWTGTRCCSEADDKTGTTTGNEYYSDTPTQDTIHIGGCWNSTVVYNSKYAPNYTNNSQQDKSIINHNGTFYGCEITNPTLLALQNTDPHVPATPQTTTTQPTTVSVSGDIGTWNPILYGGSESDIQALPACTTTSDQKNLYCYAYVDLKQGQQYIHSVLSKDASDTRTATWKLTSLIVNGPLPSLSTVAAQKTCSSSEATSCVFITPTITAGRYAIHTDAAST